MDANGKVVFPPLDEDDKFEILPYFWIPEDTVELRVQEITRHMMYGRNRDFWKLQKEMSSTMDILKSSLKD